MLLSRSIKTRTRYAIVGGDYSQQEPRILAHITQENNLIETYNNKKDLYATIGSAMFHKDYWECMEHWEDGSSNPEGKVIRKKCKQIVLGILYGMGANLLSNNLGVSIEECKEMLDNFFKMFPSIKEFTLKNEEDAKSVGYVEDYMGRRRHLPDASLPQISVSVKKDVYTNVDCFVDCDINDVKISIEDYERAKQLQKEWEELEESKLRISLFEKKKNFKEEYSGDSSVVIKDNGNFISRALTQCTNARIQGSAASLTKKAMVNIFNDERMKNLGFRILVPVHDELLGECPMENAEEVEKLLSELMIGSAKPECTVSMKVDTYVVKHWYADEVSDKIKKMYNEKISDGVKEEDAIFSISEEFPEISYGVLENMCHGDYDCFEEKI